MFNPYQLSLLRRTLAALAAVAISFTAADAIAQGKVKLSGGNKADECSYSSMSITPDGSVTVQCSGSIVQPPPGQVISISPSSLDVAKNSVGTLNIKRTNGTSGYYVVYFQLTGAGCAVAQPQPAIVELVNNGSASVPFSVAVGESGSCEVRLVQLSAGSATIWAGQEVAMLTATNVVAPPPPPPANPNCPTGFSAPQNLLGASFAGMGNPLLQMQAAGQVVAITMPNLGGLASGQVTFGESAGGAYTPQPVTLEVSINKCAGYIDTNTASACNLRSTNGNYNSLAYLVKSVPAGRSGTYDANNVPSGYCWAGDSNATYYVNARWSYAACAFGAQVCGFAIQYNQGAY